MARPSQRLLAGPGRRPPLSIDHATLAELAPGVPRGDRSHGFLGVEPIFHEAQTVEPVVGGHRGLRRHGADASPSMADQEGRVTPAKQRSDRGVGTPGVAQMDDKPD